MNRFEECEWNKRISIQRKQGLLIDKSRNNMILPIMFGMYF